MSRIAVIADTHLPRGTRRLPAECVERLRAADAILHAGDFVSVAFFDELRALGPPVHGVCGNMDEPALREKLPRERVVELDGLRMAMVHEPGAAAGRAERLASRFPRCDAVVYGHTHIPEVARHAEVLILNPGSPTERRRAPTRAMLLLETAGGRLSPELVELT